MSQDEWAKTNGQHEWAKTPTGRQTIKKRLVTKLDPVEED